MTFRININTGSDKNTPSVTGEGSITELLPMDERKTWTLEGNPFNDLIHDFAGRYPTDNYIGSPTPWGDLYKTYGWHPVQRHLKVVDVNILEHITKPEIISTAIFKNESKIKGEFNAGISKDITNTVSLKKSSNHTLSIGRTISAGFKIGIEFSADLNMQYSYNWGEEKTETTTTKLGTNAGIKVDLEPGQAVKSVLMANAGYLLVRVEFEASLSGDIATNYATPLNGHHFLAFSVNDVRRKSKLPDTIKIVQDIEVRFYTDATIELRELDDRVMSTYNM